MTAQLSWHVQNFVMTERLETVSQQNVISTGFEFRVKYA